MTYTHYWQGPNLGLHPRLPEAIERMHRLVARHGRRVRTEERPLLGPVKIEIGDCCGETFAFPGVAGLNACTPVEHQHAAVVTGCLAIAAEVLGVEIWSDAPSSEWVLGVGYASESIGRSVTNPIGASPQSRRPPPSQGPGA